MSIPKPLAMVLGATLLLNVGGLTCAQPLLRPGEPDARQEAGEEQDPEEARRQALARQKARLEEERRLKLQGELLRLQGQQIEAERIEKERADRMMRYALWIAITVIAITLLTAYARSRSDGDGEKERQRV